MKKTISIIIAAMMLISLVPCAIAAELEVKYNFDFGAKGYEGIVAAPEDGKWEEWIKSNGDSETPVWAETGTDPWFLDGSRYVYGNNFELTGSTGSGDQMPDSVYWPMYAKRAYENGAKKIGAIAIRLKIDKAGIYLPSIAFYAYNNLCIYDVYLVPASKLTDSMKGYITFNIATDPESNDGNSGLTNKVINNVDAKYHLGALSMYADTSTKTLTTKKFENSIEITEEDIADSNEEFYLFFNTGGSENTGISRTMYINIDSFSLLGEKKEEVNLDSEFTYSEENYTGGGTTLRAFAVYGTDGEVTETEIIPTPDVAYGDVAELSAPESVVKNNKKYKFLYWAKGATMEKKKIISHNAAFDYKPYEGANHLLAVYEEENATASAKEEYYNANGELLASGDVLPSMPGYGTATGWAEYKDGIYIAVYGDLEKNIEITVNGEKKKYAYGDEVICEAVAPSGKVFMYWTKDGDVVSTESTYSFCAWENAEVTAVFGDAAPTLGKTMRKIILDSFAAGDENAIMAEFIGFSDALEKGIMFGSKRVAMAGDTMQFAVIDDIANTDAVGYAIVSEDGELRLITDGEISE